jgi:hypothetical protein
MYLCTQAEGNNVAGKRKVWDGQKANNTKWWLEDKLEDKPFGSRPGVVERAHAGSLTWDS